VYQAQALAAVAEIDARGKTPLLVGGAGLYVSAVCDGLVMPDVPPDLAFRAELEALVQRDGWAALQADLERVDPLSARRIDPKNVRRVIRALEVQHVTGTPFSVWQTPTAEPPVQCTRIGLNLERQTLFARLDQRIDAWIEGGFVDEVRGLLERGYAPTLPSMSGIGYREIAQVVQGKLDLAAAIAQFKQASRQYARRQMTWFRRDQRIVWLDAATATPEQIRDLLGRVV
jgi:tRNA dimethylallyltransferase